MAYLDTQHQGLSTPVNTELEALIRARALIADPERWTINYPAIDIGGNYVDPLSHRAVRWCAYGALRAGDTNHLDDKWFSYLFGARYLDATAQRKGFMNAAELNNRAGHAAVLKMFDEAIEMAGA